jgi:hypothetical protein
MPATYEPIATTTLGSAAAVVTFSSITATYTDLIIVADFNYDTNGIYTKMTFNGDKTGTTYSFTYLTGDGSSATSGRYANTPEIGAAYMATTSLRSAWIANIMNYSNTTTYKTAMNKTAIGSGYVQVDLGIWRNTAAITTIDLTCSGAGKYSVGSTFTLYGIKAA